MNIQFWHMQICPWDNPNFPEKIPALLEHNRFIGVGDRDQNQGYILAFKDNVKVNDVIAIKNGLSLIALVQVIGGVYQVPETDDELGWMVFRRPIRVLDWAIDAKQIPHSRGTLVRCASDDVDTTKIIKQWFENVKHSFEQRNLPLTV